MIWGLSYGWVCLGVTSRNSHTLCVHFSKYMISTRITKNEMFELPLSFKSRSHVTVE